MPFNDVPVMTDAYLMGFTVDVQVAPWLLLYLEALANHQIVSMVTRSLDGHGESSALLLNLLTARKGPAP
jgi:hypothetical protein